MKLLLLSLLISANLFAIDNGTAIVRETTINDTLMQNAAQQQINNQQGVQTNRPSMDAAGGVNGNGATNLTDQEKQLSENYIDQAKANKVIQDRCKGSNADGADMERLCAGQQTNFKAKPLGMGIDAKTGELVAKAYALFGGMMDSKFSVKGAGADAAKTSGEAAKPQEDQQDNCKMIPAATETLSQFMQQQNSDYNAAASSTQNSDLAQKDALLKAAMSHEKRSENSKIQSYGWGAGAVCYLWYGTGGGFATDWKLWLKFGATTFLAAFFNDEADRYKSFAEQTRAIADALPGKGDCNPITQKICYCGTEAHKTDPQYGQYCNPPGMHNNPVALGNYRVACTDNNMKLDPACNCTRTNSCFDQTIAATKYGSALGIGSFSGTPLSPIRSIARGELIGANVAGGINRNNLAIAQNALASVASKFPGINNPMNANQIEFAKVLASKGLPGSLAQMMAQQNIPAGALASAMEKFKGASLASNSPSYSRGSNIMDFSGGGGLGVGGRPGNSGRKNDPLSFAAKKGPNTNVLEFAAKAQAAAQASGQIRESDASLFEVISNRYQLSGRRLLELDAAQ